MAWMSVASLGCCICCWKHRTDLFFKLSLSLKKKKICFKLLFLFEASDEMTSRSCNLLFFLLDYLIKVAVRHQSGPDEWLNMSTVSVRATDLAVLWMFQTKIMSGAFLVVEWPWVTANADWLKNTKINHIDKRPNLHHSQHLYLRPFSPWNVVLHLWAHLTIAR